MLLEVSIWPAEMKTENKEARCFAVPCGSGFAQVTSPALPWHAAATDANEAACASCSFLVTTWHTFASA